MKPVKTLGLAAIAAMAVVALVGISPAMASTALCKVDEDPCKAANQVNKLHLVAEDMEVHTPPMDYVCDALLTLEVGELGEQQALTGQSLSYTSCNKGCTREVESVGGFSLERTSEEEAVLEGEGFEVHVVCGGVINCFYAFNGLTGYVRGALLSENGHITYLEATLEKVKGFLCPEFGLLSALYEALEPFYIES